MSRKLFFVSILTFTSVHWIEPCAMSLWPVAQATAPITSLEMKYRHGHSFFNITKTGESLKATTSRGDIDLRIQPCNTKLIHNLWDEYLRRIKTLNTVAQKPLRTKEGFPLLTFEGVESFILPHDLQIQDFDRLPVRLVLLQMESRRRCRK